MKLLDQVRETLRVKHMSIRTEKAYVYWIERYIRHHGIRHPNTMGTPEVETFLTHLAVADQVSASTQNQALGALLFLYEPQRCAHNHELHARDGESGHTRAQPARRTGVRVRILLQRAYPGAAACAAKQFSVVYHKFVVQASSPARCSRGGRTTN